MKLKNGDYLNSTDAEDRKLVIEAAKHVGIKTAPNAHSEPDWYCVMMDDALCGLYSDGYRTGRALNAHQFTLDLFETAGKTETEALRYIFSKNYTIKDDTMKTGLQEKDAVIADIDTIRGIYKLAREIGVPVWGDDKNGRVNAESYLPGGHLEGYGNYNIVWMKGNGGLVPFKNPEGSNVIPAAEFIARMYVQVGKEQPPQDRASVLKDRIAKLRTA